MRAAAPSTPAEDAPIARGERLALAVVVLVGVGVRVAYRDRMAVEHFDEGVYASNGLALSMLGSEYPMRHLYAPPLVPWLIDWSIALFGTAGWVPMLLSLVAGCATIPLVWWVGRRWFGPVAGLASAALCATSDFHAVFSRTALTDVPLAFLMLGAVYLAWEALRRPRWRWAAAAGVVAGLAWWTKYNGWLALAIIGSGTAAWLLSRRESSSPGRSIAIVALIAVIALVVWSPVLWWLQPTGGYAAVSANHQGYFVGPSGWWTSLLRQVRNHQQLEGWLSVGGLALAPLIAATSRRAGGVNPPRLLFTSLAFGSLTAAIAPWASLFVVLALIAAAGIAWRLLAGKDHASAARLATWLLAAWCCGLLVATPMYRPYPRLTVPLLVAIWLGAGAFAQMAIDALSRWCEQRAGSHRGAVLGASMLATVGAIALLVPRAALLTQRRVPACADRTGMKTVAAKIEAAIPKPSTEGTPKAVVYVYGQPALFHQLGMDGALAVPVADLSIALPGSQRPNVPVYLVINSRDVSASPEWPAARGAFDLITELPYAPSDVVLLDRDVPAPVDAEAIQLLRLR